MVEEPKKRGRKPKTVSDKVKKTSNIVKKSRDKVYSVVQKREVEDGDIDDNIILHLPASDDDKVRESPLPYEPHMSSYSSISSKLQKQIVDLQDEDDDEDEDSIEMSNDIADTGVERVDVIAKTIKNTKIHEMMFDFIDMNNNGNTWPKHTSTACFWDCHKFSTVPIGIPDRIFRNRVYLWGCFCSYNCAASYIFFERVSNMWEKYALLNYLYAKINNTKSVRITLSPPRHSLQMFGGVMSIDTFRKASLVNNVKYRIINPPLVSVIPQLEEIQLENLNRKKANTHIPGDSMLEDGGELRLRRTKNLYEHNTLNDFISFKVISK